MTNPIQLSVIVPSYNYEKYLERALRSVAESDFDKNRMEIIVVDDKSTDQSVALVKKLQNTLGVNLRLICNTINLGLIRTRNTGIVHSNGEMLFFLDPDNYIRKDCLRRHYDFLAANPGYSACYAPIRVVYETGEKQNLQLLSGEAFDINKLSQGNYIDAMAMFRKKDLVELGMYDTKMPPYGLEDYELWLRMGFQGKRVHFINGEPLSFYTHHSKSMVRNITNMQFNSLNWYLNEKFGIELEMIETPELSKYFGIEKKHFAQIFITLPAKGQSNHHEEQTVSKKYKVEANEYQFEFRLSKPEKIQKIQFYPLNDYNQINLKSIRLFNRGKAVAFELPLETNALKTDGHKYLFDLKTARLEATTQLVNVEIDLLIIDVDYLSKGTNTFEEIRAYYRSSMFELTNRLINIPLLKSRIKKLISGWNIK
jgi:glycosyltransferase involved in cell wall biosynthesis